MGGSGGSGGAAEESGSVDGPGGVGRGSDLLVAYRQLLIHTIRAIAMQVRTRTHSSEV